MPEKDVLILTIDGETPSKKNSRITLATGKSIPGDAYRRWHAGAMLQVRSQLAKRSWQEPLSVPVSVFVVFTHGDYRRRDGDNGLNSIMDLLVDCEVIEDDKWTIVTNTHISHAYDKGHPRCTVVIKTD